VAVASSSEQRKVAAELRDGGMSWAGVAAVLRERYGLGGLAAARQAHGWSQRQAADEWCRRWPERPISQGTLSGWENWPISGRQPELRTIGRLAELYEVAASDLLAGWADYRGHDTSGALPRRYAVEVDRRQFGTAMAAAGMALALPVKVTGVRIGAADVERLREAYWQLWHADEAHGGGAVYTAVMRQLDQVQAIRDQASYGPTVGRDLQVVAGMLQEHAAYTAYDAGEHELARTHFHEALTTARLADEDPLAVYTMVEMAIPAARLGNGREVVELLQAAQRLSRGFASPRMAAVLASREAEGHALRSDAAAAQAALVRAEQELADAGDDSGHWCQFFTPEMLAVSAARTWLALNAPVAAERAAQESVGLGLPRRSRALNSAIHARTLAACGQLDQAAAVTVQAVELGAGVSSHRMRADLGQLRPALEGHEAVRGVPEALNALATV
jgi:hypothetical protein